MTLMTLFVQIVALTMTEYLMTHSVQVVVLTMTEHDPRLQNEEK